MPWYRAGTVAVALNSNTVTGTGTSFSANGRVGDAWTGPDGRWYEVTNIASNTVLTISPNYLGATVSAGTYALAPMQGYVKDSADQLRQIVNQWGATLAGLGAVSTENIVPVAKGGTGATTAPAARAILGALAAGDYGLGGSSLTEAGSLSTLNVTKFFNTTAATTGVPMGQGTIDGQGHGIHNQHPNGAYANEMWTALTTNRMFFRIRAASNWTAWAELYHTQNTTRAADGTLKAI